MTTIRDEMKTTFTETFDREWMEGEADDAVDLAFDAAMSAIKGNLEMLMQQAIETGMLAAETALESHRNKTTDCVRTGIETALNQLVKDMMTEGK